MLLGRLCRVIPGVSQLHLKARPGLAGPPLDAVVTDLKCHGMRPKVATTRATPRERHPLAHTGLLLLQVLAWEIGALPGKEASQWLEYSVQLL